MRIGGRRLLTWLVVAVAVGVAAAVLLWTGLPTPVQALARATTRRDVSTSGTTLASAPQPLGGTGFGPGPTWYSIDPWIGTIHRDGLAAAGGSRIAGADTFGSLSAASVEHDGVLFLAMTSGTAAVDLRAGTTLWTHPSRRPVYALAVADARLFAAESDGVAARDATTGALLWTWAGGAAEVTTGVAVSDDRVCFGTADAAFHVLSAKDGHELHTVRLDRSAAGTIATAGTMAFVLAGPRHGAADLPLYAIDLARGRLAWRYDGPAAPPPTAPRQAGGPVAGDGIVGFSSDDEFYAIDTATGALRWTFQPANDAAPRPWRQTSGADPLLRGALIRDGVVFACVADRTVGLTVDGGREVWRYQPGETSPPGYTPSIPPSLRGNALLGVLGRASIRLVPIDPQRGPNAPTATADSRAGAIRRPAVLGALGAGVALAVAVIAMRRWRAGIAGICCALAVATAWAWSQSYAAQQFVGQERRTTAGGHTEYVRRGLTSADGVVTIGATHEVWQAGFTPYAAPGDPTASLRWAHEPHDPIARLTRERPPRLGILHFDATWKSRPSGTTLGPQSERCVTIPHAFLILFFCVPPLAWLTGYWRDRRRHPPGCCAACGYDLRANSGRCPECGLEVAPKRSSREVYDARGRHGTTSVNGQPTP